MPVHVGQASVDAVVAEGQAFVVDAEKMQDRCMQVIAVSPAAGALVAELVAFTMPDAALDAGAGQPGDEGAAVMVASGGALGLLAAFSAGAVLLSPFAAAASVRLNLGG